MPDELPISGTSAEPAVESPAPSTPTESQTPSESSSNDSIAQTATEGSTVNDALKLFEGNKFGTPTRQEKPAPKEGQTQDASDEPVLTPEIRPTRDYTGLDEHEAKMFKEMNNKAFNYLKPIYLESKKLKADYEALKAQNENLSKESFYEHQDAYQLAPEYQHTTQNLQIVDKEIGFWKQQLAAIRNGGKWTALVGYDKDGRPQLVPDQEPTPEAEADILGAMQNAFAIKGDLTNRVNNLKTSFSEQHKKYITGVQAVEKDIFKGVDQETLNKAMAKKITLFPEHRRGVPEVQIIAKLLAVLDGYQLMLNEKSAAAVTAEAKTKTAVNGGPTSGVVRPGASKGNTAGAAMDEFNAYKQRQGW